MSSFEAWILVRSSVQRVSLAIAVGLAAAPLASCKEEPSPTPQAAPSSASAEANQLPVELIDATPGDAPASHIEQERLRAEAEGRELLVYVGATWCEPCERFKKAAAAGELDAELGGLRLLVFDRDEHEEELAATQCLSKMIPLFARPEAGGMCAPGARVEGGIKGPGAVAFLTPKVRALLGR